LPVTDGSPPGVRFAESVTIFDGPGLVLLPQALPATTAAAAMSAAARFRMGGPRPSVMGQESIADAAGS
jgi:hypothetical protein